MGVKKTVPKLIEKWDKINYENKASLKRQVLNFRLKIG